MQTAQILPLAFGLVPDAERGAVAARLVADIASRGGNAYVGVLGARYVLPVLSAAREHDAAYAVATETDEPGWGYWTDVAGFTALGEHWPADTRSRNHHFFGAIVQWFYEDLAGIRPIEPGYATFDVQPKVPSTGLSRVAATYDSVRGRIESRWRRTAAGFELDVVVPAGTRARVHVPGKNADAVSETGGGRPVPALRAEGVTLVGVEDDAVVFEVGSGSYQFRRSTPSMILMEVFAVMPPNSCVTPLGQRTAMESTRVREPRPKCSRSSLCDR